MGLFDFFKADARESRSVAKYAKLVMQKYQQTAERKRGIEALTAIGTDEAIIALLQRYKYRTDATIVDEDEKEMVYNCVVSLGERAVPGLIVYITKDTHLYWPVKALRQLVGDEETARVVLDTLEGIEDSFGANRDRREQLVDNLRGLSQIDRVFKTLLQLIDDDDEEIVIRAVDGLSTRKNDPEVPKRVVPLITNEGTSQRVRTMIMELMLENEWNVKRFKKALVDKIPGAYFIDDTGVVRRK